MILKILYYPTELFAWILYAIFPENFNNVIPLAALLINILVVNVLLLLIIFGIRKLYSRDKPFQGNH